MQCAVHHQRHSIFSHSARTNPNFSPIAAYGLQFSILNHGLLYLHRRLVHFIFIVIETAAWIVTRNTDRTHNTHTHNLFVHNKIC